MVAEQGKKKKVISCHVMSLFSSKVLFSFFFPFFFLSFFCFFFFFGANIHLSTKL